MRVSKSARLFTFTMEETPRHDQRARHREMRVNVVNHIWSGEPGVGQCVTTDVGGALAENQLVTCH